MSKAGTPEDPAAPASGVAHFDVNGALADVLDGTKPVHTRALRYYSFCVAVACSLGQATPGSSGGEFVLRVPERICREAQLHAAALLLNQLSPRKDSGRGDIVMSFAKPGFIDIYQEFLISGGWWTLQRRDIYEIQGEIRENGERFGDIAILIDALANVPDFCDARTPGISAVLDVFESILEDGKTEGVGQSGRWSPEHIFYTRATLKRRWKRFGPVSIFSYLEGFHAFKIQPPLLSPPNFAKRLLARATDQHALKRMLSAYLHVWEALPSGKGYKPPRLQIPSAEPLPGHDIVLKPLDARTRELFKHVDRREL